MGYRFICFLNNIFIIWELITKVQCTQITLASNSCQVHPPTLALAPPKQTKTKTKKTYQVQFVLSIYSLEYGQTPILFLPGAIGNKMEFSVGTRNTSFLLCYHTA